MSLLSKFNDFSQRANSLLRHTWKDASTGRKVGTAIASGLTGAELYLHQINNIAFLGNTDHSAWLNIICVGSIFALMANDELNIRNLEHYNAMSTDKLSEDASKYPEQTRAMNAAYYMILAAMNAKRLGAEAWSFAKNSNEPQPPTEPK